LACSGSHLAGQLGYLAASLLPHGLVVTGHVTSSPCRQQRLVIFMVTMTRKAAILAMPTAPPPRSRWRLQDAKARFSELVRIAHSDGPQHVTLHGRDAVVVVDADEFNRLQGSRTGELLIEALQASPHRQLEIEPRRSTMPVRAVKL